jgi:peptidoglycan/xylan/chitin deacetylase (PgdA/CDA1 family)
MAEIPRMKSLGEYEWKAPFYPRLLDLLEKHRINATFFVTGINTANHPAVFNDIIRHGHELACHGMETRGHNQVTEGGSEARHSRRFRDAS